MSSKDDDIYTSPDMSTFEEERSAFCIARADAIGAYAHLERSLTYVLSHFLGGKPEYASLIVASVASDHSRRYIIETILFKELNPKYHEYIKSFFGHVRSLSGRRNQIVHWHMQQMGFPGKVKKRQLYALIHLAKGLETEIPLYWRDLKMFAFETNFFALQFMMFEQEITDSPAAASWPQSWHEIFLQPVRYPPQKGSPQYESYLKHQAQLDAFPL